MRHHVCVGHEADVLTAVHVDVSCETVMYAIVWVWVVVVRGYIRSTMYIQDELHHCYHCCPSRAAT